MCLILGRQLKDWRYRSLALDFVIGKLWMLLQQPFRYGVIQLGKMSREEVIPAANDRHFRVFLDARRKPLDHRAQLIRRTEPIEFAGHQKFRLVAAFEIREAAAVQIADREAEAQELRDAWVPAASSQTDPGAKTETREEQGHAGIFRGQKIKYGDNVLLLTNPFVVSSFAQAHSAKVEPHDGQRKPMNCFGGLINHFVVHRPAKPGMGVADDSGQRGPRAFSLLRSGPNN